MCVHKHVYQLIIYSSCCVQIYVDTPETIKNLHPSTLEHIRKEGCFIIRCLPDGVTVQCKAIQDGYTFTCPRSLLINVKDQKQRSEKLYASISRRCGCGISQCDENSLLVREKLIKMGLDVPMHKRVYDWKEAKKYVPFIRSGLINYILKHVFTYVTNH